MKFLFENNHILRCTTLSMCSVVPVLVPSLIYINRVKLSLQTIISKQLDISI